MGKGCYYILMHYYTPGNHSLCRLAYASYMLEQIKKSSKHVCLIVLHDIACTLHQHLQVSIVFMFMTYIVCYGYCRIVVDKIYYRMSR